MNPDISRLQFLLMRFLYFVSSVLVGFAAWPKVIHQAQPWDLMHSVMWAIYAAFSLLMLLGVMIPLRMLPLLLLQFAYKTIWIFAVALPLLFAGHLELISGTMNFFGAIVILDLLAIPWLFVYRNYIRALSTLADER